METLLLSLALLAAPPAGTHPFSVDDMLAMERVSAAVVSPDGTQVAFSVRHTDLAANKGRFDVWLAHVDGSGVHALTRDPANDTQPAWSPDGKSVYFVSTRSGSAQVWRQPVDAGDAVPVTKLPVDVDAFSVVPDGKHLVVGLAVFPGATPAETQARLDAQAKSGATGVLRTHAFTRHWDTWANGTRDHLFVVDIATGAASDLMKAMDADCPTKPFGDEGDWSVSPDSATVVFSARDAGAAEPWSTNFDLYAVPLDGSAAPRKLTTNPATDGSPRFSADGKRLAWLAMDRPGYESDRQHVVIRDWTTAADKPLDLRVGDGPRDDRSVAELTWSRDGRELLLTADHLGDHPVFAMDAESGSARILASHGTTSRPASLPGGRVLFTRNSLMGPDEIWTVSVDGKDERRVTHLNDAQVAAARFGQPEQFHFAGANGDTVYAYVVKPVDFDPARKYPIAFIIHGSPESSMSNDFHYRWNPQAYAGAGYAALFIDFHASTGYGQAFTDAVNNDWGGKPYEDLVKGFDHALATYPWLDGGRACALGASYGGYMVNWINGHPFADRFKCLVTHDGNLDERAAYYMTEELWFPEWEHGGPAWENPEGYEKDNPVNFVKNWHTPTLVIHGGKDFRVVETQGIGTFNALQRRGVPSEFLYFPDENHWVLKPANSVLWHRTVLGWLDRWTKTP